jgi:hypothetical protein
MDGVLDGPSVEVTAHRVGYIAPSGKDNTRFCDDQLTQYFTLPHIVRAESEDSPSSPRTVLGLSELSEYSPRTVRTVRGQS